MSKTFLNRVFGILIGVGFLLVCGTAGSSDLGRIDFKTAIIQSVLGILIGSIGFIGLKILNPGDF